MIYPYDGIRSMIEYYEDYISNLKKQIEDLQKKNKKLEDLIIKFADFDDSLSEKVQKIKK